MKNDAAFLLNFTKTRYCLLISEWDEVPSDEEDTVIKEDESKYVCLSSAVAESFCPESDRRTSEWETRRAD